MFKRRRQGERWWIWRFQTLEICKKIQSSQKHDLDLRENSNYFTYSMCTRFITSNSDHHDQPTHLDTLQSTRLTQPDFFKGTNECQVCVTLTGSSQKIKEPTSKGSSLRKSKNQLQNLPQRAVLWGNQRTSYRTYLKGSVLWGNLTIFQKNSKTQNQRF